MLNNGFPLIVIWHVHIYQCLLEPSGRCNVSTPGSDHTWLYCCDNFEDINNTCIECEIGYKTLKGKPCQPCSGGYYGRRCVESCKCKQNERCDHVVGCLELSTIDDKSFYTGHSTIEESITVLFPAENITRNQCK
ncbi:uncharacterized protein LOC143043743 [Mytilus galloprovincialis]|uniref:uncharacterized protein LOC143043743 n=1 Tax=Mytilus galloprovincialis TaxID=29158 RepID=UPI003F7BD561